MPPAKLPALGVSSSRSSTAGRTLVVAGAALMLLAFPLDWSQHGGTSGDNPFHYPLTGGIAWLVVVGIGVVAVTRAVGIARMERASPTVVLAAVGIALALMSARLIDGGRSIEVDSSAIDVDRGAGMWLAFAATLITTVGALITRLTTHPPPNGG